MIKSTLIRFMLTILMKRLALFTIFLGISTSFSACRTSVPEPSNKLNLHNTEKTTYKMHNNSPQRASQSNAVHFVDLNQDGNLDLLIGGNSKINGFHVEWGDRKGNWALQTGPVTSMQPKSFATADVNHNKAIEVLIGGDGAQKGLQVWQLNPKTQSWSLHSTPIEGGVFSAVKFADINNDSWVDIVASKLGSASQGGVSVFLNNGLGGWIPGVGPTSEGIFTDLGIADINNDGNLDIIASRRGGLGSYNKKNEAWKRVGGIQIWYGDGNSRWESEALPARGDAESVTIADIDGDGLIDIFSGLYQKGIVMWLNRGTEWEMETIVPAGTWGDIRVGDLDADGSRELIASSNVGHGLRVWSWRDASFYADEQLVPKVGSYLDIDLGDIHNNGTLSIAASRSGSGVEVWSAQKSTPLPIREFIGEQLGITLSIYFDSGSAWLNSDALGSLNNWLKSIDTPLENLKLKVEGLADKRPINSELFPNNIALSKARAEAVTSWLLGHNASKQNMVITALGDKKQLAKGSDPTSLKQNRRVFVQAYKINKTRLPQVASNLNKVDLYNIKENKVFRTIDGVAEYKVGVGDELSITFWQGGKSETKKVIVQNNGTVSLPYQAALKVAGSTPSEIDDDITGILRKYERNPRIDVQLLKARSKFASVFGEVQSLTRQPTGPGTYALRGKESLVDFLSRIGGPTRQANLDGVQIIREGKTILLNLNRAIRQGDLSENAIIDDGDTIFIPSLSQSKRQVYVLGQVTKAGIVEFTGEISFLDAVSKAGGMTKDAYMPDIRVLRANRDQPEVLAVDFEKFLEQGDLTQNLSLMDKDIIIIPSRPIANWNKFIADITPSVNLLLQPVSIAQQILTLRALSGDIQ